VGHHRKGEETRDTATAAAREGNIRLADALTKLKRAQVEIVQQERVRALEQVITGVARDFNDMLAPVLTMSDYLLDDPKKLDGRKDLEEDIRVINSSARKTLRQVKVLTDLFQSFEEPSPQRLRLTDVIDEAEGLVVKGSRHVMTAYKIDKDFDDVPFVVGNEVDYMEAIRNLIENALESMEEGSSLKMSIKEKGKAVVLSIRDDGQGMSDEVYKRALEPFFSTKGKGHSGMGLTFVVVAIGKFGGSLDIKSAEGQGTTVSLTIPVYDPKLHKRSDDEKPSGIPEKLKILVVDDEEWTRVVLARSLSSEGHEVETADGGAQGLEKFETGEYDIVVLDRAMPDMTGDEVAARVAASGKDTAVIMLTGFGDIMIEKGEIVDGVDLVMSKPVTIGELRAGMSKVLTAKKA
jgi:CheY-like chemotaxis protein/nitrogen-specific signal transduction histidine kinase